MESSTFFFVAHLTPSKPYDRWAPPTIVAPEILAGPFKVGVSNYDRYKL